MHSLRAARRDIKTGNKWAQPRSFFLSCPASLSLLAVRPSRLSRFDVAIASLPSPVRAYPQFKGRTRIRVQTSRDDTSRLGTHNASFDTNHQNYQCQFLQVKLTRYARRQRLIFLILIFYRLYFYFFLNEICTRNLEPAVEFSSPCRREIAHTRDSCHIIPCFSLPGHTLIDHPGPIVPSHPKEQCVS